MDFIQKRKEAKRQQAFNSLCQAVGYWTITAASCAVIIAIIIISLNIIL